MSQSFDCTAATMVAEAVVTTSRPSTADSTPKKGASCSDSPPSLPPLMSLDDNKLCEVENDSPSTTPTHNSAGIIEEVDPESDVYGELILLGYNGVTESPRRTHSTSRRTHLSKMVVRRRSLGNGIKKGNVMQIQSTPDQSSAVQDASRHVVSYSYTKDHTVLVEYTTDATKDMFQIGRSSESQIDFSIVDTWIESGTHSQHSYLSPLDRRDKGSKTGSPARSLSSTISRYACRIMADREESGKVYLFAAGFDSSRNIFLGEKATKWQKKNSEYDGLTTNGVLVLHPNRGDGTSQGSSEMYEWREVSVDGDIYSLRETRSSQKRGSLQSAESNQLQDGTLIDLCGATLLWRSAEGLKHAPSRKELERRLDELNAGRPQCPVNLNTLIIPKKRSSKNSNASRQPYVYMQCGHVQGKHDWGITRKTPDGHAFKYKCPICMVDSDGVIQITMGMESGFHLDSESLDYAFNPCGHMASLQTVQYWSRIPLPHGTNSFHPVCPFCTCLLNVQKPFIRLIFQDHCDF